MPSMDRREAREAARALLHLQAQLRCALYGCGTGRLAQAGHPAPLSAAGEEALARAVMRVRVAAFLHPALEAGRVPVRLPAEYPGLCRQAYFGVLRRNLVLLDVGGGPGYFRDAFRGAGERRRRISKIGG